MKLSQVVEGWKNHIFTPADKKDFIKEVSKERKRICSECEWHSKNHKTMRPDAHCTNCGCTLAAKTKCLSCACPLGKWTEIIIDNNE